MKKLVKVLVAVMMMALVSGTMAFAADAKADAAKKPAVEAKKDAKADAAKKPAKKAKKAKKAEAKADAKAAK